MSDRLSILVDENVPYALESFGNFGTVRTLPGRRITATDVKDVDALITRSITRVDEALLSGSAVKFVGSATIGVDHVDVAYLQGRGIEFASAPGSNATSVAEYIVAALLQSSRVRGRMLEGSTIAIVGVGNVGSRVEQYASGLGMRCVLNDPPLRRQTADPRFIDLEAALADADYVTMHVPLEHHGPDATINMVARQFFETLRPGAVFMNTARGAIVDEAALAAALDSGRVAHAVLDVWQNEPAIDPQMVRRAFLATPHIAGYSFDGKVVATAMIYDAMCRWLGRSVEIGLSSLLPAPPVPRLDFTGRLESDEDLLRIAVSAIYDIEEDDRALRQAVSSDTPGIRFDLLRKHYEQRREFRHTTLVLSRDRENLARKAAALGFLVERAVVSGFSRTKGH